LYGKNPMGGEPAKAFARKMFGRIASRYESTFAGWHSGQMKKAALACLDQHACGSVLDVGCGPGLLLAILASQRPELRLAGIDIAPEMVKSTEIAWEIVQKSGSEIPNTYLGLMLSSTIYSASIPSTITLIRKKSSSSSAGC
jgi:SAM-dependent methyltransferase